jgi:hypothetical protein
MTRREIIESYRRMEADDGARFQRWLTTNSVIASAFVAALIAIIAIGPGSPSNTTIASGAHAGQVATAAD